MLFQTYLPEHCLSILRFGIKRLRWGLGIFIFPVEVVCGVTLVFLHEEHAETIMRGTALCVAEASAGPPGRCRPWDRSITPLPGGRAPRFYLLNCRC